jgi:hypothetical protein
MHILTPLLPIILLDFFSGVWARSANISCSRLPMNVVVFSYNHNGFFPDDSPAPRCGFGNFVGEWCVLHLSVALLHICKARAPHSHQVFPCPFFFLCSIYPLSLVAAFLVGTIICDVLPYFNIT